ncbi:MAG: hypothetical protein IKE63_02765 [Bacilli bacterium]|nr:hypothetical protein [Bacilli bacterium]
MNIDDLIEYLVVTDQVDEFFGLKEEQEDDEDENENEEENNYRRHR